MAETWHTDREATWPDIIPFSPLPVRLNGSFRGHPRKANSLQQESKFLAVIACSKELFLERMRGIATEQQIPIGAPFIF